MTKGSRSAGSRGQALGAPAAIAPCMTVKHAKCLTPVVCLHGAAS